MVEIAPILLIVAINITMTCQRTEEGRFINAKFRLQPGDTRCLEMDPAVIVLLEGIRPGPASHERYFIANDL